MAYYRRNSSADRLARGLGWFSIGQGVAELVAGRRIARERRPGGGPPIRIRSDGTVF